MTEHSLIVNQAGKMVELTGDIRWVPMKPRRVTISVPNPPSWWRHPIRRWRLRQWLRQAEKITQRFDNAAGAAVEEFIERGEVTL